MESRWDGTLCFKGYITSQLAAIELIGRELGYFGVHSVLLVQEQRLQPTCDESTEEADPQTVLQSDRTHYHWRKLVLIT
jgi:hypothetical protein